MGDHMGHHEGRPYGREPMRETLRQTSHGRPYSGDTTRDIMQQDEDSVLVTNRVQRGETSCALTRSTHLAPLSEYLQTSLSGSRFLVPCENKCAPNLLR